MTEDDSGILIFLGLGVLVLIGIVVFGILSSRRKKRAQTRTWTVSTGWIGDQPFLQSSDLALDDSRQEELFRLTYPIGGRVTVSTIDDQGQRLEREFEVSRIGRSLRAGFPHAKIGLTAYFGEWEGSEFPAQFVVKASDKVSSLTLDAAGATAHDPSGTVAWSAPWATLLFSNGSDILLSDGAAHTVRIENPEAHPELEEILIKYGTLTQMHF